MKKFNHLLIAAFLLLAPSFLFGATYYSRISGTWATAATWSTVSCGGAAAASVPGAADNVIICSGITVTLGAVASCTNLTIQNGGILQGNKAVTINAAGTFTIAAGGTYIHNFGGGANPIPSASIFNGTENFAATSTFQVDDWEGASVSLATGCSGFGNLILNWNSGASFWANNGLGSTCPVSGNLQIGANCSTFLNNTAGNVTITIGGNLISSSGVSVAKYNSTGDVTLNITGSTTITTGVFYVKYLNTGNATMTTALFTEVAGTFIGVNGGTGSFTFTCSGYTMNSGIFRGIDATSGAGNFTMTVNGNWTHSGGQLVGIDFPMTGNLGTTNATINGNLTLTAGSIIWHSTDITDGRTCAVTISGNCSLSFTSGSDFFIFNNITSFASNTAIYTLTIGGNLTISGSTSGILTTRWTNTGQDNIYIAGDMTLSGGTTSFGGGLPTYMPNNTLNATIGGNVSITGAAILLTQSSNNTSKIDLTLGTAAVTWAQTSTGTVSLTNTNIKSGKTVTLTGTKMGNIQTSRTATVETGAKLYCSNYPVSGTGLFTLASGAHLGIGSAAGIVSTGATGNIQVTGARSYNSGATYEYYESLTPQASGNFITTTTNATYPSQVANLIINKGAATNIVNLTNTTDVTTLMTLTQGVLTTSYTSATAPWVRIPSTASVSPAGGSSVGYVDGYIRRTGNSAFVFPTGNGGKWRRISMLAPSISTEFEARYVSSAYSNTTTFAATPTPVLNHVSTVEHWFLTKPLGADAATTKVSLYWESAAASGIYTFDSLTVAKWSGTGWENTNCYGSCPAGWLSSTAERTYSGSATGTGAGYIQSNTVSSFSPFTLGSIGAFFLNPLPIELISNEATCDGKNVVVKWATASEKNNNYFTIQKSIDGVNFTDAGEITAAGNSTSTRNYSFTDYNAYSGISYYRLKQTDYNGDNKTFNVITAENCNSSSTIINAFNDQSGSISIIIETETAGAYTATLYDALGKKMSGKNLTTTSGKNNFLLDISSFNTGIYYISINNGKEITTKKIFIF